MSHKLTAGFLPFFSIVFRRRQPSHSYLAMYRSDEKTCSAELSRLQHSIHTTLIYQQPNNHSPLGLALDQAACFSSYYKHGCWWWCWWSCVDQIQIWWHKFRQLVPLLTNKDISLIMRGRLYSSSVQSNTLHGSETWPVRKENEVALQRAELRMVTWMCGVKVIELQVKSWETRIRWHNLGITAKQVALVWTCVAKRSQWLGEETYGVWSGGCQTKR